MPYNIKPTKEFAKDISKLDKLFQKRIKDKLEEIAIKPERYKHLHYSLKESCRFRINKLRVLFSYSIEKQELYAEKIVFDHDY